MTIGTTTTARNAYVAKLTAVSNKHLLDFLVEYEQAKEGAGEWGATRCTLVREELLRRLAPPRIDVVVVRHPDYENDVTTYVDGKPAEVHEWSFDPGAGYEYTDFCEMWTSDVESAPAYLKPVLAKHYRELRRVYEQWSTDDKPWPAIGPDTL
jgi:hypothetical protein